MGGFEDWMGSEWMVTKGYVDYMCIATLFFSVGCWCYRV